MSGLIALVIVATVIAMCIMVVVAVWTDLRAISRRREREELDRARGVWPYGYVAHTKHKEKK